MEVVIAKPFFGRDGDINPFLQQWLLVMGRNTSGIMTFKAR